jgi:hypothetical protein
MTLFAFAVFVAVEPPNRGLGVPEEVDGTVMIEAERFAQQSASEKRAWHFVGAGRVPRIEPDGDEPHLVGASAGAYIEALPDTRRTHADPLVPGENFSPQPGKQAVVAYPVRFRTPGRYYVWARAFSTGTEDNGIHVGLDGQWPSSGQRMQWCEGKGSWRWESKQRTDTEHCGVPGAIYLDVPTAGLHVVQVSMREDGFELDQILLTTNPSFAPPQVDHKADPPAALRPRKPDGGGTVQIGGERKRWHKVTLTLDGPFAHERDDNPNPFTDYRMTVTFTHASGSPSYTIPGYFAADGDAANTSADQGTKWRAHLSPDKAGRWDYVVSFVRGPGAAIAGAAGEPMAPFDGRRGSVTIAASDARGRDLRAKGRLQYVDKHHLRFAGSGEYFLKAGPDAPETLLAYTEFDDTEARRKKVPLKTWAAHERDFRPGDPTWKNGKGKGLVGALNYLAKKGLNAFSFITYNVGGDGDNVWPFVAPEDKRHYDCSKLDQWGVVFDHAQKLGLFLHFKLQETENDDHRSKDAAVPAAAALDAGELGPDRRLYLRELIARFGHALALNWNLGEESTQSPEQQRAMSDFLRDTDPYQHHRVIHTFPDQQDQVYPPLLGKGSSLTGVSLQNMWDAAHQRTLKWVTESARAGRPWVVANDEQGSATLGVPPDPGFAGFPGKTAPHMDEGVEMRGYDLHDVRKATLWGNLMAGGAGVEYYFGYELPQNDLVCEDYRSRDRSWDFAAKALRIFQDARLPFWEMKNENALVGNSANDNSRYCLTKPGEVYAVYLPAGGASELDLTGVIGSFAVSWWNPRQGGKPRRGAVTRVEGGAKVSLGAPPADPGEDWLVVVRRTGTLSFAPARRSAIR